jgi:hypothetical protein
LRRRPIAASESHGTAFLLETHKHFLPRRTREQDPEYLKGTRSQLTHFLPPDG